MASSNDLDDDEVLACPECDRTPVVGNALGGQSDDDAPKYRCYRCGAKFDEARKRARRGDPDIRPDTLAGKLEKTDADDLLTDGGVEQKGGGVAWKWVPLTWDHIFPKKCVNRPIYRSFHLFKHPERSDNAVVSLTKTVTYCRGAFTVRSNGDRDRGDGGVSQ